MSDSNKSKIISFLTYKTCKDIKAKVRNLAKFNCDECKNEIICGYKNSSEIMQQFEIKNDKTNNKSDIEIIISCKNYKNK